MANRTLTIQQQANTKFQIEINEIQRRALFEAMRRFDVEKYMQSQEIKNTNEHFNDVLFLAKMLDDLGDCTEKDVIHSFIE